SSRAPHRGQGWTDRARMPPEPTSPSRRSDPPDGHGLSSRCRRPRGACMDTKSQRLRLLFSDILGLERGKYLFGEVADAGHAAFCIGVYPLTTDKEILPVPRQQFDIGLPDVEADLDRNTLRTGWEEDTLVGIADISQYGLPLDIDPRQVLRAAVDEWRAMDLEPQMAFELEFYLCEQDGGAWVPAALPSHRVYGTGMSVDPTGTIDDMVAAALRCGFPVESWNSEFDTAAF